MIIKTISSIGALLKIFFFALGLVSLLTYTNFTNQAGNAIYDNLFKLRGNINSIGNKDIKIVAIDDNTIQQLGGFPTDKTHLKFIFQLQSFAPKAIILDPKFTINTQNTEIIKALSKLNNVYMPYDMAQEIKFSNADKINIDNLLNNSGHFVIDTRNGVVRYTYNNHSVNSSKTIPSALVKVYKQVAVNNPKTLLDLDKNNYFFIPFNDEEQIKKNISYISVLKDDTQYENINSKYVILTQNFFHTNQYKTPLGLKASASIYAATLDGLINENYIINAGSFLRYFIPTFILLLSTIIIWFCLPKTALILNFSLSFFTLFICAILLRYNVWFSPIPTIIGIIFVYLLSLYKKVSIINNFIDSELLILNNQQSSFHQNNHIIRNNKDRFESRIQSLRQSISNTKDLQQFVHDNINCMPDVLFVTQLNGEIFLQNNAANAFIKDIVCAGSSTSNLPVLFSRMHQNKVLQSSYTEWLDALNHVKNNISLWQKGIEINFNKGKIKHAVLRIVSSNNRIGSLSSWIWLIHDLTEQKHAEQQRDDMLRFLSHDMRAPQSSIIASIELHRKDSIYNNNQEQLLKKIESYAHHTLSLSEDFVQLAKAESQVYDTQEVNIANLVMDVSDDMWPLARKKNIKLDCQIIEDVYVLGDRLLLNRCLANLVSNAIKYTDTNKNIFMNMELGKSKDIIINIIDEGMGISEKNQTQLFEKFVRFEETKNIEGIGLGLVFVKIVVEKHKGTIVCNSEVGKGTKFSITIPIVT